MVHMEVEECSKYNAHGEASGMPTSSVFSCVAMSLIRIMCAHSFKWARLVVENLIIKVLASAYQMFQIVHQRPSIMFELLC
jgi:hypothetical protein